MEFKKNYFLANAIDNDKSIPQYVNDADENYVVLWDDEPLVWGDGSPVIFGSEVDYLNELENCEGYLGKDENDEFINNIVILTEQDFLLKYCTEELCEYILKALN